MKGKKMNLNEIQQKLKAPKNQRNTFGNYNYRSCEDILEAVKPLLGDCWVTLSDEMVYLGDRYYIKATVSLHSPEKQVAEAVGYAREPLSQKGMNEGQLSGSTSSYARKYALDGLFCIDDTKDIDTNEFQNAGNNPSFKEKYKLDKTPEKYEPTKGDMQEAHQAYVEKHPKVPVDKKLMAEKWKHLTFKNKQEFIAQTLLIPVWDVSPEKQEVA